MTNGCPQPATLSISDSIASLHDDRSTKHVHAAYEADLAGALRRELDDDRFVERQRTTDIQGWKDDFCPAGLIRRANERNLRQLASPDRQLRWFIARFSYENFGGLHTATGELTWCGLRCRAAGR